MNMCWSEEAFEEEMRRAEAEAARLDKAYEEALARDHVIQELNDREDAEATKELARA